jgi:hypothetical protein
VAPSDLPIVSAANWYSCDVAIVWIGVALAAGALMIIFVASQRGRVDYAQLGTMSEQWLAEQRANDRPY